ncbi:MAG: hypothetical protein HFF74_09955 [Oscillospiraceae bacterium]|nr:hypothetical protein [Oscillospiraceae bacterium]
MSHNFVIRAYCRQVGKALDLPRKHKRRLLDGLERELEEHFSCKSGLTLETLYKDAGSPEESAVALMDCVDERVRTQCWSRQKRLARLLITGLAALAAIIIAYYFYAAQYEVDHAEVRIVQYDFE